MRFLRWLAVLGLVTYVGITVATWGYTALHQDPSQRPNVAAIVAISGPWAETIARMERANALYAEGAAPTMIVSGGTNAADDMFRMALAANIPEDVILKETRSRSTLQNALYIRDDNLLALDAPFLLVTHRYHLPRAAASFRWAGYTNFSLVAADSADAPLRGKMFWLEGVKWPLNILRAAFGSTMMALDIPQDRWERFLD